MYAIYSKINYIIYILINEYSKLQINFEMKSIHRFRFELNIKIDFNLNLFHRPVLKYYLSYLANTRSVIPRTVGQRRCKYSCKIVHIPSLKAFCVIYFFAIYMFSSLPGNLYYFVQTSFILV